MPALFGYLCALCLLLGGGYGALSWLAAPEPAHVVRRHQRQSPGPMMRKQKFLSYASEFIKRQHRCGDFFRCQR